MENQPKLLSLLCKITMWEMTLGHRTGVLTFDGNVNLEDKVTYTKIQKHLGEVYGRHFGYGTVFELCVPRNKHRRSSKRYRDLAKVTSRRARKGFCIQYNPDMRHFTKDSTKSSMLMAGTSLT